MTHDEFAEVYAKHEAYQQYQHSYQLLKSAYDQIDSGDDNQTTRIELTLRGFKLMHEIPVNANKKVTLAVIQSLMAHYIEEVRVIDHFYSTWFKRMEKATPIVTKIQLLNQQLSEILRVFNAPTAISRFDVLLNDMSMFSSELHSDDTDKTMAILDILIFAKRTQIERLESELSLI